MKRPVFIGLLMLLALASCHSPRREAKALGLILGPAKEAETQDSALAAIDSLTWRQPDSALDLLLPWFDTCRDVILASPTNKAGDTA
ncbi:MAG: hypothetical protein IJP44_13720 [Bacteroidales bacterium]|nr:hypothetical protein [Bacteroidales bacterium]